MIRSTDRRAGRGRTFHAIAGGALMLAAFAVRAAPETSYRLAGIIGGSESPMALIELPDGRQRLYRAGDVLDEGKIIEISPTVVRIQLRSEDLLLRLRGNPTIAERALTPAPSSDASPQERIRKQQLSAPEAARLLAAAQAAGKPEPGKQPPSDEALSEQLNDLLEIPVGARITAVDDVSVQTPAEGLAAIASRLDQSHAARLTVSGVEGLDTVFLALDSEQ